MRPRRWPKRPTRATSSPWRSGLEEKTAEDLTLRGVLFSFEQDKLNYVEAHVYTPDFRIGDLFIETKGYFEPEDRAKHLRVRESNPEVDIRFLFQNASKPIRKGSKTTYGQWATKNGFLWCEKRVPQEWIDEQTGKN